METVWFVLLAVMLTGYVVLDGFDLGTGVISHVVARNASERRLVLRSIGPVWDGNEVWLISAGGIMFFAFPVLYAVSFSGFYLPLMMVLWLLMGRGIGIELRGHIQNPLWQSFWDAVFSLSSGLLVIFFGAALGNVIRGVPLTAERYFFAPLWTDFRVGPQPGILDWYTILTAIVGLVALTVHGASWVAAKTEGEINERAHRIAASGWWLMVVMTIVSLIATIQVRPEMIDSYRSRPWGSVFPLMVVLGLSALKYYQRKRHEWSAFLASTTYLIGMLSGAAFGLYPYVLPASSTPAHSLTIYNSATGAYGLRVGVVWWVVGMLLALTYFSFLYYSFRGKVTNVGDEGY